MPNCPALCRRIAGVGSQLVMGTGGARQGKTAASRARAKGNLSAAVPSCWSRIRVHPFTFTPERDWPALLITRYEYAMPNGVAVAQANSRAMPPTLSVFSGGQQLSSRLCIRIQHLHNLIRRVCSQSHQETSSFMPLASAMERQTLRATPLPSVRRRNRSLGSQASLSALARLRVLPHIACVCNPCMIACANAAKITLWGGSRRKKKVKKRQASILMRIISEGPPHPVGAMSPSASGCTERRPGRNVAPAISFGAEQLVIAPAVTRALISALGCALGPRLLLFPDRGPAERRGKPPSKCCGPPPRLHSPRPQSTFLSTQTTARPPTSLRERERHPPSGRWVLEQLVQARLPISFFALLLVDVEHGALSRSPAAGELRCGEAAALSHRLTHGSRLIPCGNGRPGGLSPPKEIPRYVRALTASF